MDYVTQFKQNHDAIKIHLGQGVLNYFVENKKTLMK